MKQELKGCFVHEGAIFSSKVDKQHGLLVIFI